MKGPIRIKIRKNATTCLVLLFAMQVACQPRIGDGCKKNVDCSPDGDRICDLTQPGGYCTVPDCTPGSCPDNAVCVRFWSGAHSRTWCMKDCHSDGDCRGGYYCAPHQSEIAVVIDEGRENTGYCIEKPHSSQDAEDDGDALTLEQEEEDESEELSYEDDAEEFD